MHSQTSSTHNSQFKTKNTPVFGYVRFRVLFEGPPCCPCRPLASHRHPSPILSLLTVSTERVLSSEYVVVLVQIFYHFQHHHPHPACDNLHAVLIYIPHTLPPHLHLISSTHLHLISSSTLKITIFPRISSYLLSLAHSYSNNPQFSQTNKGTKNILPISE